MSKPTTTASASALSEPATLRTDERPVRELLDELRYGTAINFRERLAARLDRLLDAYKEDSQGKAFSAASLRGFISFLENAPGLQYPAVTITRDGELYTSWKQAPDKVFSIQFMETGQARFVVFRPNPIHAGQSDQMHGLTTPDVLLDAIAHLGVLEWVAA